MVSVDGCKQECSRIEGEVSEQISSLKSQVEGRIEMLEQGFMAKNTEVTGLITEL